MKSLRCACLVAKQNDQLLLVRVRQNQHWYLPGGKIEAGESAEKSLERELDEELGITIEPQSIEYLYTVKGPAYGELGEVELVCFSAQWRNTPQTRGEISEIAWLHRDDLHQFAPAVQILCTDFLSN